MILKCGQSHGKEMKRYLLSVFFLCAGVLSLTACGSSALDTEALEALVEAQGEENDTDTAGSELDSIAEEYEEIGENEQGLRQENEWEDNQADSQTTNELAVSSSDVEYLEYRSNSDGTLIITGCDTSLTEVVIPGFIDGAEVTAISYMAFQNNEALAEVEIPDTVTSVGEDAFDGTALLNSQSGVKYADTWLVSCDTDVTSAEIREGTTGIADKAFSKCVSLTTVSIPDSVLYIGGAFPDCSSLTSVTIPDGVTEIDSATFIRCKSLASVTIPDGVTSIGSNAFASCSSLAEITLPDSVTIIEDSAFLACDSFTTITIPDNVTDIEENAFKGCESLKSVVLGTSVVSIGERAFTDCFSLETITVCKGLQSIGDWAFHGTSLSTIYYTGNESDWQSVSYTSERSADIIDATVIYNYSGN